MSKGSRPRRTEAQRLIDDTPEHLRLSENPHSALSPVREASASTLEQMTNPGQSGPESEYEDGFYGLHQDNSESTTQPPGPAQPLPLTQPDPPVQPTPPTRSASSIPTPSTSADFVNTPNPPLPPSISRGWVSSIIKPTPKQPPPASKTKEELEGMEFMKSVLVAGLISATADKIPIWNPDRFDGTKLEKLDTFEGQCRMVFLGDERKFNTPQKQALYAGSYLDGAPYEWWLQELRKTDAEFKKMAEDFWNILQDHFRNPNHIHTVEQQLTYLQMKEMD
ncbi:hypothetical protein BDM02DRAFT_3192036 [Thelephora ganbajun]|uniref:Uncharacterized protein n=1 Tax=Thelephora ganbajun TaxID=370292 RepID=A0ACB6Z0Q3_THEGA|nr:hypothetical protein BDM02DRAFT_3192036 [Thelephora ganbajun]